MSRDTEIIALDDRTVERIAAGEVVERPASVVKELVENSLDAGATRVDVTVEGGGTERIHVADDGHGMSESQARRAVKQHTTSKITDAADLEGGVGTLGFRGEALHAIGAVSRLTLRTRRHEADRGTEITVEGGDVTDVSPVGTPPGTVVDVTDLFYNVPARRKYLKQDATEFAHINRIVSGYALACPDVAISLTHGDSETFGTEGAGDRRAAVLAVYGRSVARNMIAVDPGELPEGPLDRITGLVSHPETNRSSRDYLSTFVNGRYVTAAQIREAIVEAYGSQLGPDRYPFAVLELDVDPATVDINVHPRKLEVRFADTADVQQQVVAAVSAALMREGILRTGAPRGSSAPAETAVDPGGDKPATSDIDEQGATPTESGGGAVPRQSSEPAEGRQPNPVRSGGRIRAATAQSELDGSPATEEQSFGSLPPMRLLGQFRETYILGETDDGLIMIDQHAADERINYERLRAELLDEVSTQALVEPVTIELTAGDMELFDAHQAALSRLGFQAERRDDQTVAVHAVPDLIGETADPALLRDVLDELIGGVEAASETVEAAAEEFLADLACYPSITGNTSLSEGSAVELLERLGECENPWACPHGRPTVIVYETDEIEARFERDYPGHHP